MKWDETTAEWPTLKETWPAWLLVMAALLGNGAMIVWLIFGDWK